ncbi:MAG: di-heme enzyme [Archangiaceae bacterium]|nr:di-heme enzyme [Archangiaceae bacterium]
MSRPGSRPLGCVVAGLLLASCGDRDAQWRAVLGVPRALQLPAIPENNPPTEAKLQLGRRLFYDVRLSGNQTQSCASCHDQKLAFTDGKKTAVGSTGHVLTRNAQGLQNAAYNSTLTWANDGLIALESQLAVPIRNDRPVELGVNDGNVSAVLARFENDSRYPAAFRAAFPESASGPTVEKIIFALATFCRSLVGADSPYDRYLAGDKSALTDSQKRGLALFNGERLECFHCHSGSNLTTSYRDARTTEDTATYPFFNNGLYNLDGGYPPQDQGLYEVTLRKDDRGRFRPQSLRNVALTAPYMHDGSLATLDDVLSHYAAGGTVTASGPLAGDGRLNPLKSGLIRGFVLTAEERGDVLAFLNALTDVGFVENPAFAAAED